MERILIYLQTVPDYLQYQFNNHMAVCVVILTVYLFALIFTNRIANLIRPFVIGACICFMVYGAFQGLGGHGYQAVLTGVLALALMFIFRLLKTIIVSSYQNKVNARIEQKALEKAAKRRGTFSARQGYSGNAAPAPAPAPKKKKEDDRMTDHEIRNVVDDYYTETLPDISAYIEQEKPVEKPAAPAPAAPVYTNPALDAELTGPRLGREEVYDLLAKLTALYDAQILTGDEFEAKKLLLLRRI